MCRYVHEPGSLSSFPKHPRRYIICQISLTLSLNPEESFVFFALFYLLLWGKKKGFSVCFFIPSVFCFLLFHSLLSVPQIFPSFGRLNHKRDVIFKVQTDRWSESAFGWIIIQCMNRENIFHWSKICMSVCVSVSVFAVCCLGIAGHVDNWPVKMHFFIRFMDNIYWDTSKIWYVV